MKYTNKHNLPHAIMATAMDDRYDKGDADISVTELIAPYRHRIMDQAFGHVVTKDVSLAIAAMMGTAMHKVFQEVDEPQEIAKEERLFVEVEGWTVSGQIDRHEVGTTARPVISDYKVCKAYAVMQEKIEWEQQINCYRYLVQQNYNHVPDGQIIAFITDWSKMRAEKDPAYPNAPIVILKQRNWTMQGARAFVQGRVQAHQDAQRLYDELGEMPLCTAEDRWYTGDKWAVYPMRNGKRVRTKVKLFDTANAANHHTLQSPLPSQSWDIERRPGSNKRCEDGWCEFAPVCEQWKHLQREQTVKQVLDTLDP